MLKTGKTIKTICITFLLLFLFSQTFYGEDIPWYRMNEEQLGKYILNKGKTFAKNKIKSKAKSFINELLGNIFPALNNSQVSLVHLSEDSYERLSSLFRSIISDQLVEQDRRVAHADFIARLDSLQTRMSEYNYNVATNTDRTYLYRLLEDLNQDTSLLINHREFNPQFNSKYWLHIHDYSMAVSLRYTILMELFGQEYRTSLSYIIKSTKIMQQRLTAMNNLVISHLRSQVKLTTYTYMDNNVLRVIYTVTSDAGSIYFHGIYQGGYGPDDPHRDALAYQEQLIREKIQNFGDFSPNIQELAYLSNPVNFRNLFDIDLISYWKFDDWISTGRTNPSFGRYSNPGTMINYYSYATTTDAKDGRALKNGTILTIADSDSLDIGTRDLTIACWVKTTQGSGIRTILDKRGGGAGYHLVLYNGRVLLQLDGLDSSHRNYYSTSTPSLADGNWHMITVTVDRDSATGLKIYIDGTLEISLNPVYNGDSLSNSAPLFIGKHASSDGNNFEGIIDELRIYSRSLTAAEVWGIYSVVDVY